MKNRDFLTRIILAIFLGILITSLFIFEASLVQAGTLLQQPTVDIPTVTGTKSGPVAIVNQDLDRIYVRAGPGQGYPIIGILVTGQKVPALGQSSGGEWIEIIYLGVPGSRGWVYKNLVSISGGSLAEITPPPTPVPQTTPTLNPTLAARYPVNAAPTSLPTFTLAPPLAMPTFAPETQTAVGDRLPIGLIIIGLAVVGFFGTMITLLRGR